MKLKTPKDLLTGKAKAMFSADAERYIYFATGIPVVAFALLHKSEHRYGLAAEISNQAETMARMTMICLEAEKLLGEQPAVRVAVGNFNAPADYDRELLRNELRAATIYETFSEEDHGYFVTVYEDGITAGELRRPAPPSSLEYAASLLEKKSLPARKAAERPKTAKGVERWIRAELAARHKVPAASAGQVLTLEEAGLGSLDQLNLLDAIEAAFGLAVPSTATWETGTIRRLAEFVFKLLQ